MTLGENQTATCTIAANDRPPVAGRSVGALRARGTVRVKRPGGKFRVLREGDLLPNGTTIDTLRGRVTLIVAANKSGKESKADFYDGVFKLRQSKGLEADDHAHPDREAHLPEGRQRDRGGQEEEAPAVGRRQRKVPHEGQAQRSHRGRNEVAGGGSLRQHAHARGARPGLRSRLRAQENGHRAARKALHRAPLTTHPTVQAHLTEAPPPKTIARRLPSRRRGLIRFGAAAAAAALVALALPGAAAPQFGNVVVDTTADGNDGECANDCTLREAIALADQTQGQFVSIRPGVYRLTLGPLVLQNDTVFGVSFTTNSSSGARSTVIDARGTGRAIEVPAGSSSVLAGVTITGGNAPIGGGILIEDGAQLAAYDTIIRDNVAAERGGGILNAGSLSLFFATLTRNRAAAGGGIASQANTNVGIVSATFSGNTATSTGGGISAAGSVTIQRATIANNTAPSGGGLFLEDTGTGGPGTGMWSTLFAGNSSACGGFTSERFPWSANLSDDASCAFAAGEGVNGADPLLIGLANNGGPTDTHAIRQGSPAIDAGDQQLCAGTPDQRHAPPVGPCDIGAFEFGGRPPVADVPPPVAGETVNVSEARGIVRVKLPGSDEFFDLEDTTQVPVGSTFDTVKGRVNLVAAGQQRSWFYEGVFKLGQTRGRKPLSTLTLTGALSCGKSANAAAKKKRRLWGDGKGKFRTKGKHSAATVVGTRWLVEDRCNGTLTRVVKGRVRVRDFRARRTVVVKAGKQYLARAR